MNIDLKRYGQFGWDYDYINPLTDKIEMPWGFDVFMEKESELTQQSVEVRRHFVV